MMSEVDLVILDFDGGENLERCLRSIEAQTIRPARVVVFDNGSRSKVSDRIGRFAVDLIVERSETNLGFAAGINEAMKRVEAPYVGWINNDVTLAPEWLETVSAELDAGPRVAAVQTIVLRPDGLVDGAGITIDDGTYRQVGHGERPEALSAREPWGVSATAAIYRVSALRAVSAGDEVLDSRFFAWYEDVELCARLREGGWSMRVVPSPLATHVGSATSSALGRRGDRLHVVNRYRVCGKHPGVGDAGALLMEDVRRSARMFFRGEVFPAYRVLIWAAVARFSRFD